MAPDGGPDGGPGRDGGRGGRYYSQAEVDHIVTKLMLETNKGWDAYKARFLRWSPGQLMLMWTLGQVAGVVLLLMIAERVGMGGVCDWWVHHI